MGATSRTLRLGIVRNTRDERFCSSHRSGKLSISGSHNKYPMWQRLFSGSRSITNLHALQRSMHQVQRLHATNSVSVSVGYLVVLDHQSTPQINLKSCCSTQVCTYLTENVFARSFIRVVDAPNNLSRTKLKTFAEISNESSAQTLPCSY